jgi:hypothetical protein
MSRVALAGNASGTGTFTIAAPNSNSDRTLTLPDEAGTVLTSASSIARSQIDGGAGKILQVVTNYVNSDISTGSGSYVTTGFSASITPSSTSSKILVSLNGGAQYVTLATGSLYTTIYRGATDLANVFGSGLQLTRAYFDGTVAIIPHSILVVDSPSTTSSTTYTCYMRVSSGTHYFSLQNYPLMLTLMEIAA